MAVGSEPNTIFAEPTTWTGSIGVIIPHFDVSGGLGKLGISEDSIASGPLKKMGSPTRPMSPEEKKILQTLVDDSFKDFKAIVASGRPKFKDNPAALDAVATGQIFTAKQALAHGLVDKIGFIDVAIARATVIASSNVLAPVRPPGTPSSTSAVSLRDIFRDAARCSIDASCACESMRK